MALPTADFYSLVQRRIWNDAGFRKLSRPAPNARDLFLYLLTTPHATQVPGLVAIGESAMAEDLEWPLAGLRKALGELETAGMVKVDRGARLLWLPNGLKHNPPKSPDNILGWAKHWRMLPECDLLREAAGAMMIEFSGRKGAFAESFARVSGAPMPPPIHPPEGDPPPHPMGGPMGTPEGDPKGGAKGHPPPRHQIQTQDQDLSHTHGARAHTHEGKAQAVDHTEARPSPEPSPTGFPPVASAASLLAAVARHPMLATLHGDRTWAQRALGPLQAALCRAEDADAAIDAFVADRAASAPQDGPSLDAYVRDHVGRYLKRAKEHGDAARARFRAATPPAGSSGGTTPQFRPRPGPPSDGIVTGSGEPAVESWRIRTDLAPPPPPKASPRRSLAGRGPMAGLMDRVLPGTTEPEPGVDS